MRKKIIAFSLLTFLAVLLFYSIPQSYQELVFNQKNGLSDIKAHSQPKIGPANEKEISQNITSIRMEQTNNKKDDSSDTIIRQLRASEAEAYWAKIGAQWTIVAALGSILVAIVAVGIGLLQWSISHKATKKELRAYLSVSEGANARFGSDHISTQNFLISEIVITNNGNTPAKNIRLLKGAKEFLQSIPADYEIAELTPASILDVPAQGKRKTEVRIPVAEEVLARFKAPDAIWNLIKSDGPSYKVFGCLEYEDVFQDKWHTKFSFNLTGTYQGGLIGLNTLMLEVNRDDYNQAT